MKKIISLVLLIGWIILIFILSNQNSVVSNSESNVIVEIINTATDASVNTLNYTVRKIAHITEYLILCLLMYNYIRFYSKSASKWAILFSLIYAIIDETHQLFIDGRNGQPLDILIDSIGIFFGYIIEVLYEKKVNNKISN